MQEKGAAKSTRTRSAGVRAGKIGKGAKGRGVDEQGRLKFLESKNALLMELLGALGRTSGLKQAVSSTLSLVRDFSGCEAVGIRLKQGDDYPYYEANGFVDGHVELENQLCARDEGGEVVRDSLGNPLIECMCGNIIQGRFNPALPFFTAGGSFWSNCTTELLASTSDEDRQARTRNRCNGEGYESVALIPIRGPGGNLGLLQLNDRRRGMFTPGLIEFYEDICLSVGIGLERWIAEDSLRNQEQKYRALFEHMTSAGAVYRAVDGGRDFVFTDFNRAAEDIERLDREKVIGRRVTEAFPGVEQFGLLEVFRRVWRTGEAEYFPLAIYRDDRDPGSWRQNWIFKIPTGEIIALYNDETQRVMGEKEMERAYEMLSLAQRASVAGVWSMEVRTGKMTWSPELFDLFGLDAGQEPSLALWLSAVHPLDRQAAEENVRRAWREHSQLFNEYRVILPSGSLRWINASGNTWLDAHGQPERMAGICMDVTARKVAETQEREKEAMIGSLLNSITESAFLMEVDGTVLAANEEVQRRLNLEQGGMVGRNAYELLAPDVAELRRTRVEDIIATGKPASFTDQRQGRYIINSIWPICDESGGVKRVAVFGIDVTEAKRAEIALSESEQRFRKIFQDGPLAKAITGPDFRFQQVNAAFCRMLSYSEAELLERTFADFTHPEHVAADTENVKKVMVGELAVYKTQKRYVRKDGTVIWGDLTLSSVRDPEGNFLYFLAMIDDVTERKRAERELAEQERAMRTMISNLPGFVYRCANDPEWTMEFISDGCLTATGYAPSDFIGNAVLAYNDIIHPAWRDRLWEKWQDLLPRREVFEEQYPIIHRDGGVRWVWERGRGVFSDSGELLFLEGFITDITEKREAEESLAQKTQLLNTIMENSASMLVYLDRDFNFVMVNQAYADTCGYRPEEMVGKNHFELYPDEENERIFRQVRDTGVTAQYFDKPFRFPDQPERGVTYWTWTLAPTYDERGAVSGLVFSLFETTSQHRLEEERQRSARLESVGTLAGGIAHDFNNILTAILGNLSLARAMAKPEVELYEPLLEAEKASIRAKSLTQQLLTFSKGGLPVKKLLSLGTLIREAASFASRGSGVSPRFSLPGGLWQAEVDPGQVGQVISNLVINAVQAMPAGGAIDIKAENMALEPGQLQEERLDIGPGDYIRISVSDSGTGIPADLVPRIFDPYFTTKQKGSGLGLATAFSIVRNHNGCITVRSEQGKGSTFSVYLPASRGTAAPGVEEAGMPDIPALRGRVLVMDDEEGVRGIARHLLARIGFEDNAFAADGAEAVRLYREAAECGRPFSLVVLDLTVPGGMGGLDTLKELLKIDPGVKAVVSSGYTDSSIMADCGAHGFSGVIAKPYTIDELRVTLAKVLQ